MRNGISDIGYEIWDMRCEIWDMRYEIWDMRYEIWDMKYEKSKCKSMTWNKKIYKRKFFFKEDSMLDMDWDMNSMMSF